MSDTLDRLKALNSKLEAKLSQKKGERSRPRQKSLIDTEEEKRTDTTPSPSPVILKGRKTAAAEKPEKKKEEKEKEESLSGESAAKEQGNVNRLTQILLHHLEINSREEPVRAQNLERLAELYLALDIGKKAPDIRDLFIYKAMNISGIGLKEEDFGEIREGKYVQVIAITYEPDKNGKKKAKNISLGYFGKAETLDPVKKNQVIEFVLRWRYEKAFQNLEHYRMLLDKVRPKESLF
jgi:hypothetical protein